MPRTILSSLAGLATLLLITLWSMVASANPYVQTRLGLGGGRYRPLDRQALDVDEHNFLLGAMADVEVGAELGNERVAFLVGGRVQYSVRLLKGTFTAEQWRPKEREQAHIPAVFLTLGARVRLFEGLSAVFQANFGPSFIIWAEHGRYEDHFWKFYLPLDLGLEYQIDDSWRLTAGVSVSVPIYLSSSTHGFLGFRKTF